MSKLTDDAAFALAQRNYDNEPEPVADEIEGRCECGETTICGRCPRCDNEEAFHGE